MKISKNINKIIYGDCLEKLTRIENESVNFIFADRPYFIQTTGKLFRHKGTEFKGTNDEWDKFKDFNEYDNFCIKWLKECKRILKSNGTICVIGSFQNVFKLGYHIQNLGFWLLNDLIWNKSNPVPNFKGTRFCNAHETLIWTSKSKDSKFTFNYKFTIKYLNNNKQEKSVWTIPLCNGNERLKDENNKKIHNAQKPLKLIYKIISATTKPGDLILDPFFGTGAIGVAAKTLNRNWIGIENDSKYIEPALKRINETITIKDNISDLKLEVKLSKISLKTLVENNYLYENQKLYNKNKDFICTVNKNGQVNWNDKEISIHKLSANLLNRQNYNEWKYFWCEYKNKFILMNEIRYFYAKEQKAD